MAALEALVRRVVEDAGIQPDPAPGGMMYLPGFHRETKSWDVVHQYKGHALAIAPMDLLGGKDMPEGMGVDLIFDGMSYAERDACTDDRWWDTV